MPALVTPRINYVMTGAKFLSTNNGDFTNRSHWLLAPDWNWGAGGDGTWFAYTELNSRSGVYTQIVYDTMIQVTPGATFAMSCYVYLTANMDTGYATPKIDFYDANNNFLSNVAGTQVNTGGPHTVSVSTTVPAGAAKVQLQIYVVNGSGNTALLVGAPGMVVTGGYMVQDLYFQIPATNKSYATLNAKRTDIFSTSGKRQTTLLRTETKINLNVPYILAGTDVEAWRQFLSYAVEGGNFMYYPDYQNDTYAGFRCFLVDTSIDLKRSDFGIYSFTGTLQREL